MKYTVVIRQPVPEAVLGQLSQELSQQFELNTEQASRLASRRNGRLMKPTSRRRAERLMEVFQGVGAQVTLEEVRDDTTLVRDPYASERPGLVGPASLPISAPPADAPSLSPAAVPAARDAQPAAAAFGAEQYGRVQPGYGETDFLSGSGYVAPSPYGSGSLTAGDSRLPGSGDDANSAANGADFSGLPTGSSGWGGSQDGNVAVLRPVPQTVAVSPPAAPDHAAPAERPGKAQSG